MVDEWAMQGDLVIGCVFDLVDRCVIDRRAMEGRNHSHRMNWFLSLWVVVPSAGVASLPSMHADGAASGSWEGHVFARPMHHCEQRRNGMCVRWWADDREGWNATNTSMMRSHA